jgi:hypothetical protein
MSAADFRKWLAFGSGVGIEIARDELKIMVARVRPTGVTVAGEMTIHRFREQPAAEWGAVCYSFLKKLGAKHLAASVLLPRTDVIVRQIALPGVADRDLAAALRFEIDSLHPYSDEEALFDWARIGRTSSTLVAVTRRSVIDQYAALFAEAGVKVAGFTVSGAALYSAARLLTTPPIDGFVAVDEQDGELEVYGESPARPLFSARFQAPFTRARTLAISELRLPPETEPIAINTILPQPVAAPEELDLRNAALPYATALAAACPRLSLRLNLLPPEERRATSRLRYVPTAVLAGLTLLLATATLAYPSVANKRYLTLLQGEIRKLEPHANQATALDRVIATTRNRSQTLDNFRGHTSDDMEALRELTKILEPPTWLTSLQLTREAVTMSGETEQAAGLLKLLDSSKQFQGSDFTLPMQRMGGGETFFIRSARKGVRP